MKKRIAALLLCALPFLSAFTAAGSVDDDAAALSALPDSPDWVAALGEKQEAEQLFVIAGVEKTTAWISLHEKDADGRWKTLMTTPGCIGIRGLGKKREGDRKTPTGVFRFNAAFGAADDPGCAIAYHKLTEDDYWSGDTREGYGYNQMVSIRDLPDLDVGASEHLIDILPRYEYCLNISYNEPCVPGLGSAIFLHCLAADKPYTAGCVAIPRADMLTTMQHVRPDCVVVIDSLKTLSPETWSAWGL
ncbi:MAG: L,D-transpeptidase family protein [Oscillospiraceae bacterium]|nr:L,D-transpeptidase family protein [Oscillospiraceae bacterium]